VSRTVVFFALLFLLMAGANAGSDTCDALDPIEKCRRAAYVEKHPEITEQTKQDILSGSIRLGMTTKEVNASWGLPRKIKRSVYTWGIHEQWIYGTSVHDSSLDPTYLYFEDDILTGWQD